MDKLDGRFRGFRSGVTAPSGDAVSAARELLRREIGSSESPRPSRPKRPWEFVAVAAAILVGGLLVTPAFGLGSRLLDLIHDRSATREVQTPVWSPEGRTLAFVSRRDGNSEVYVMNADGSGQQNLSRHQGDDSAPTWSPDGRRIAFVSRRDGNSDVYVVNADGSGLRNLTRTPSNDLDPAWSPDGRAIAFVQKIQGKCVPGPPPDIPCNNYETYLSVVNGDGSGLRRLTTQRAHVFNHSWSADGKTIRYGRYLVHADDTGETELPRNLPLAGAWSPDGQRIAFAVAPRNPRDRSEHGLWVMNADGSNPRRVARNAFGTDPAWSPDGRRIAFRRFDGQLFDGPQWGSAGPSDLHVVNADGSGLRRLTRSPANERWFAWSPDGRKLSFVRGWEIYVVNADGSGERRLTQDSG